MVPTPAVPPSRRVEELRRPRPPVSSRPVEVAMVESKKAPLNSPQLAGTPEKGAKKEKKDKTEKIPKEKKEKHDKTQKKEKKEKKQKEKREKVKNETEEVVDPSKAVAVGEAVLEAKQKVLGTPKEHPKNGAFNRT